jgi:mandelamide amidase
MARTVADVALLDSVITGVAIPPPARLDGLRVGVPAALWSGLEGEVNTVMQAAKRRLADAGVVFVDADLPDILALSEKIIFPVALHEPIADIAKYLEDSGATGITVTSIIDQIASPDVKKTLKSSSPTQWQPPTRTRSTSTGRSCSACTAPTSPTTPWTLSSSPPRRFYPHPSTR